MEVTADYTAAASNEGPPLPMRANREQRRAHARKYSPRRVKRAIARVVRINAKIAAAKRRKANRRYARTYRGY